MREHDWEEPPIGISIKNGIKVSQRGNLWKCRQCGAVIDWNGWPANPISDPHYEIPRLPQGNNRWSPVLSSYPRDCDLSIIKLIMES